MFHNPMIKSQSFSESRPPDCELRKCLLFIPSPQMGQDDQSMALAISFLLGQLGSDNPSRLGSG